MLFPAFVSRYLRLFKLKTEGKQYSDNLNAKSQNLIKILPYPEIA